MFYSIGLSLCSNISSTYSFTNEKNIRLTFDDELKIEDVRYDNMTKITIKSTSLLTFTIWNKTLLKNELFLSNRRFKKRLFFAFLKSAFLFFFIKLFLHTFCQKQTFCYPATFFKALITHKRFIFKESYISYGKRQKNCTLFVVWVKYLYLTSPIFKSSSNSNRIFFIAKEEVKMVHWSSIM